LRRGPWIDELVSQGVLHSECARIFRVKRNKDDAGAGLRLHRHQLDSVYAARAGRNYVLTTGTGSGKSLAYIVPIVDAVLRGPRRRGIKAIVVYPMNALANSRAMFTDIQGFASEFSPIRAGEKRRTITEPDVNAVLPLYPRDRRAGRSGVRREADASTRGPWSEGLNELELSCGRVERRTRLA
jgi:hypothetical protein